MMMKLKVFSIGNLNLNYIKSKNLNEGYYMDFLDFFENMGLGITAVVALFAIIILIGIIGTILPGLLVGLGGLLIIVIQIIVILAVIYFIGKFLKSFIK